VCGVLQFVCVYFVVVDVVLFELGLVVDEVGFDGVD